MPAAARVRSAPGLEDGWNQRQNECDPRSKAPGRRHRRNRAGDRAWVDHRARHTHPSVPALQYSFGLDGKHAVGRRLLVRVQVLLWLHALLVAVLAADLFRPYLVE